MTHANRIDRRKAQPKPKPDGGLTSAHIRGRLYQIAGQALLIPRL